MEEFLRINLIGLDPHSDNNSPKDYVLSIFDIQSKQTILTLTKVHIQGVAYTIALFYHIKSTYYTLLKMISLKKKVLNKD